ncbi:hypothetical protein GCM10020000_28580 [Streptomyces olivoverticillatus]
MTAFLSVKDLFVRFSTEDGTVKAVDGLSFDLERGRTLGIVGESGSGKSVTSLSVLGLHDARSTEIRGEILLDGQELTGAPESVLEKLRGDKMAMIFQDSLTALSPYYTVGRQIAEPYRKHTGASKREARQRAVEMLEKVGIPNPSLRVDDYPPPVLRRDAPARDDRDGTGLRPGAADRRRADDRARRDRPGADPGSAQGPAAADRFGDRADHPRPGGVVANTVDELLVMYAGRAVERGSVREVLRAPQHPYTWGGCWGRCRG